MFSAQEEEKKEKKTHTKTNKQKQVHVHKPTHAQFKCSVRGEKVSFRVCMEGVDRVIHPDAYG